MIIYNKTALNTAKVLVIRTYIEKLGDTIDIMKQLLASGIDRNDILFYSMFDKKPSKVGVVEVRECVLELEEFLKAQSNINVVVDATHYHNGKSLSRGLIFKDILGKDVGLWSERGVLIGRLGEIDIKMICGVRGESVVREMCERGVVDREFLLSEDDFEIVNVTDGDVAKDIFKELYKNAKEVVVDTETNSLSFDRKDAKLLTLQITTDIDPNKSYVFWIDHIKVNTKNNMKEIVGKGIKWLMESGKKIIVHNFGFDGMWIKQHLCPDLDFYKVNIYDTMLIYHFLTNNANYKVQLGLKEGCFLNGIMSDWDNDLDNIKKELIKELKIKSDEFNYEMFDVKMLSKYSGIDTIALYYFFKKLYELNEQHPVRSEINIIEETWEQNWQEIMQSIYCSTWSGIPFDIEEAEKQIELRQTRLDELNHNLALDININKTELRLGEINFQKALDSYHKKCEDAKAKGKSFGGAKPDWEKGNYGSYIFNVKFNAGSPTHKQILLYDVLKLPIIKQGAKSSEKPTGAETMEELFSRFPDIKVLQYFSEMASITKELGTYLIPFMEISKNSIDGRIRSNPVPLNTSLRLRASEPSTLNLPKTDFKKCIKEPNGNFIYQLDYSALEAIVGINLTKDDNKIKQYYAGITDLHAVNAIIRGHAMKDSKYDGLSITNPEDVDFVKKNYPEDRQSSKSGITFPLQYLGSHRSIQAGLKISEQDAKTIYDKYWSSYFGERQYYKDAVHKMATQGYLSFFGKGCIITPEIIDTPEDEETLKNSRTGYNSLSQSGSYLTLSAQNKAMRRFKEEGIEVNVLMSVHDSIIYSCSDVDAIYVRKVFIEYMTEKYAEDQPILLKADAEIGVSYKAERAFEGTEEELKQILKEMRKGEM